MEKFTQTLEHSAIQVFNLLWEDIGKTVENFKDGRTVTATINVKFDSDGVKKHTIEIGPVLDKEFKKECEKGVMDALGGISPNAKIVELNRKVSYDGPSGSSSGERKIIFSAGERGGDKNEVPYIGL